MLATALVYVHQPLADTQHMTIEFGGSKAGECQLVTEKDGTFKASATINIGAILLSSICSGKHANGVTVSFSSKAKSPQAEAQLDYKPGALVVTSKGKTQTIPYDIEKSGSVLGANLIPLMLDRAVAKVKFEDKKPQKVNIFLLDAGSALPFTFTPKETKHIPTGEAHIYSVSVGTVSSEIAVDQKGHVVGFDVKQQQLRWIADGWSALYTDPLAKFPELSKSEFEISRHLNQKVATRDGVNLMTDVYLPDKPGKYPVILLRTPYGRKSDAVSAQWYVSRGYAVVDQDCRGRGDSDGEWDPFVHERQDGYDAIDWISKQEWCDGNVGMIGGSYGGYVQWSAAVERHPALKCIIPQVSPPDAMHNLPYDYGTIMLFSGLWWARIVQGKDADMSSIHQSLAHPEKLSVLPLSRVDDEAMGTNVPFFDLWLKRYRKSDWKGFDYQDDITKVTIPALHISGWWDGDEIGTNLNWEILRKAEKKNQWLVYGPWVHAFNTNTKFGDQDYGPTAIIELDALFLRWFDTWLKHKDVGWEKQPKVRAFITGANKWTELADWPDEPRSTKRRFYFSAPKGALAPKAYGALTSVPLAVAKPVSYTYDPAKDTVPKEFSTINEGDRTTIEKFDVSRPTLVFQTDPLSAPLIEAGKAEVNLSFSTNAKDTDFFAIIGDIDQKGNFQVIGQSGKIRASYIRDLSNPSPLTPGKLYQAKIRLWDTGHEFKKGHRVGVAIMSSLFPVYSRNLGFAEPPATATKMIAQKNTIYFDSKRPSYIEFFELNKL